MGSSVKTCLCKIDLAAFGEPEYDCYKLYTQICGLEMDDTDFLYDPIASNVYTVIQSFTRGNRSFLLQMQV